MTKIRDGTQGKTLRTYDLKNDIDDLRRGVGAYRLGGATA